MNRVLSWPHTHIMPGLLKPLKQTRVETEITERGTVRFELPMGPVEMGFLASDQELPAGTPVYVWWKGGGFVCASVAEVRAEEHRTRRIAERVLEARARLQAARQDRALRDSELGGLDALPPSPRPTTALPGSEHPLLQRGP